MKDINQIDKTKLLQLCGEMNAFIDEMVMQSLHTSPSTVEALSLNKRFAELTGSFPDSECERASQPTT